MYVPSTVPVLQRSGVRSRIVREVAKPADSDFCRPGSDLESCVRELALINSSEPRTNLDLTPQLTVQNCAHLSAVQPDDARIWI